MLHGAAHEADPGCQRAVTGSSSAAIVVAQPGAEASAPSATVPGRAIISVISSTLTGLANRYPCIESQPSRRNSWNCSAVSTPSAVT